MEYLTVRQAAEAILRGEKLVATPGTFVHSIWIDHGNLDAATKFTIAPKTITIGGMEVPEPCRTAPKNGTKYFTPALLSSSLILDPTWSCDGTDLSWLKRGLVHLTKEAAITHAEAMIKVSGGEV
jgi:hypothetical protein